ncbi:hypothetical protein O0I10_006540 [Lichtheimia ornata]|uniref:F-box domain-containing protein n=1 Tax=Lichtheimia ornata TaxID=688661 RepID=A0AAD7XX40_9FUNG|nr:uncharacterized protein O0I10_006540 [Lichtheimia ornata]KAJ8657725.1 hypothetical protein O0I10_006540 [Lichtheimia ornata]
MTFFNTLLQSNSHSTTLTSLSSSSFSYRQQQQQPPSSADSSSSFNNIPNELVLHILRQLGLRDLLVISVVNTRLYHIGVQALAEYLASPPPSSPPPSRSPFLCSALKGHASPSRLRLFFDQESRWQFSIDMIFEKHENNNGSMFIFVPVEPGLSFQMFSSKVLRKPSLYRVSLLDESPAGDADIMVLDSIMSKPLKLDIKYALTQQYDKRVDGQSAMFSYKVHDTPTHRLKSRPGERWMQPISFQCDPWWLIWPRKSEVGLMRLLPSRGSARLPSVLRLDSPINHSLTSSSSLLTSK